MASKLLKSIGYRPFIIHNLNIAEGICLFGCHNVMILGELLKCIPKVWA